MISLLSSSVLPNHFTPSLIRKAFVGKLCIPCVQAKSKRSPFPTSTRITTRPLELVHSDLQGPYRHPSFGGHHYIMVLVDEHTDMIWAIGLRRKSDAEEEVKVWVARREMETGQRMGIFRTDGGGEYSSKTFASYLATMGTRHETSIAGTSSQNGKAERTIQLLQTHITSLLVDSGLGPRYWMEAMNFACRIIELLPSAAPTQHRRSRYEAWYGITPSLENIHRFGSDVLVHDPHAYKFEPKSVPCIYLGPAEVDFGKKAHRVQRTTTGRVFFSRNVTFTDRKEVVWESKTVAAKKRRSWGTQSLEKKGGIEFGEEKRETREETVEMSEGVPDNLPALDASDAVLPPPNPVEEEPIDGADEPQIPEGPRVGNYDPPDGPEVAPISRSTRSKNPLPPIAPRVHPELPPTSKKRKGGYYYEYVGLTISVEGRPKPKVPLSYKEAISGPFEKEWRTSMKEELSEFERNQAWARATLREVPTGKSIVSGKWHYTLKPDPDDHSTIRFKSRYVARGFELKPGLDYFETYAPVSDATTRRLTFAIVASEGLHMRQGDVTTAFLTAKLDDPVYMKPPPGYEMDPNGDPIILEVHGAIYGLPQSPRAFNKAITAFFTDIKLVATFSDKCLYVGWKDGVRHLLLLYVDDFALAAPSKPLAQALFKEIEEKYTIKDLGSLNPGTILAIDVKRELKDRILSFAQPRYVQEVLDRFDHLLPPHVQRSTPMPEDLQLSVDGAPRNDEDKVVMASFPFKEILGCLNFIATQTRFDISYAVSYVGQFQHNPGISHRDAILDILLYLRGTVEWGLALGEVRPGAGLEVFTDADWGGDHATSRSTMGVMVFYNGSLIYWTSKRITSVSKSVQEAEFIAFSKGSSQVEWILQMLEELGYTNMAAVDSWCDNKGAIAVIRKGVHGPATRHIRIAVRSGFELFEGGIIDPKWVGTEEMPADILTKPLGRTKFERFRAMGGLKKLDEIHRGGVRVPGSTAVCGSRP
jgi:hypothetical protein